MHLSTAVKNPFSVIKSKSIAFFLVDEPLDTESGKPKGRAKEKVLG